MPADRDDTDDSPADAAAGDASGADDEGGGGDASGAGEGRGGGDASGADDEGDGGDASGADEGRGDDDASGVGDVGGGSAAARGDGALGAAWGGPVDDDPSSDGGPSGDAGAIGDSGPLPSAEEVRARNVASDEGSRPPHERSVLDRITIALQDHKTAFTVALLLYALLVMPWLYGNGYEILGLLGGAVFLGGVVLLTVANVHKAQSALRGEERRGF